jgi:hypothetical protein
MPLSDHRQHKSSNSLVFVKKVGSYTRRMIGVEREPREWSGENRGNTDPSVVAKGFIEEGLTPAMRLIPGPARTGSVLRRN